MERTSTQPQGTPTTMQDTKKLHIVMFPWLAFGHMIPFLELSKCLATKGHHIFFVSTPKNLQRLSPKIPQNLTPSITLIPLPLLSNDILPSNAEATSDLGFEKGADILKKAYDNLEQPMKNFLESSSHPFDWIIYDFTCHWLPPVADKLGIQKVFFSIFWAQTLSILGPCSNMANNGAGVWVDPEILTSPPYWIPISNSNVYYLPYEAKNVFKFSTQKKSSGASDMFRFRSCVNDCDLIAVRSCVELEAEYLQLVEKLDQKAVIPVGLLPPSMEEEGPDDDTWQSVIGWLGGQKRGSVVYVALGSEAEPSQDELIKLALGLELSGVPFFWALRRSGLLPEGFEDRTRDRGVVWTSWAPQLRILSHDSVGVFLTHAGWSSIIEGLQFGKPLIMLPMMLDQGMIARFMEKKKVGVMIPRDHEDGSFTGSSIVESLTLVLLDEGGKMYKDEAKKVSVIFGDKNLHSQYIDKFSDYLCNHKVIHRQI